MTVKDVFDLRKQGKIEEAYEAIRPMYAVHKGKYTTLCMFWTANDILKKRVSESRIDEAELIFKALWRILPYMEDTGGRAFRSLLHKAVLLANNSKTFSILDFIGQTDLSRLNDDDWISMPLVPTAEAEDTPPYLIGPLLLRCAFNEIENLPTVENALKAMPLLQEAIRRDPWEKSNQHYLAVNYRIMGERNKAVAIYQRLLERYDEEWIHARLSELTDDFE